jgi:hypothetical protein
LLNLTSPLNILPKPLALSVKVLIALDAPIGSEPKKPYLMVFNLRESLFDGLAKPMVPSAVTWAFLAQ